MKVKIAATALAVAMTLGLAAGCGSSASKPLPQPAPSKTAATTSTKTAPAAAKATDPAQHVNLYLAVLTGGMDGKKGWPEFVPGNFTVPANTIVDVQIRDFDDGPASIPAGDAKVVGTIGGTMKVIKALNGPVDQQPAQTVTEVPAKNVAHTLTFDSNGFKLNIPLPPLSTVEFSFKTPAAGTYTWQCEAACGSGTGGWGGAMATSGWMKGTMTVK